MWGVPRPRARGFFRQSLPGGKRRRAAGGGASEPLSRQRHDWRPRTGAENRCAATVGYFAAPAVSPFLVGQKGAKKPLRTCGSKESLCPDVYCRSYSPCGATASERRLTLRLPMSPRFSALVRWVDGSLAADSQRTSVTWSAPARADRSGRTSHPQLSPEAGATIPALSQIRTAQQNSNQGQGHRLPNPAAPIIGGRQAESYYTPCQYAATTTQQSVPYGRTQGSQ